MREFLYLDDISVLSLYSSRFGPVPQEFTDSDQRAFQADAGGEIGFAGPPSGKATAKLARTRTVTTQVLRKASVQATFKEWWAFESVNLAFKSAIHVKGSGPLQSTQDLLKVIESDPQKNRALRPSRLDRGAIVEIEVELQTAEIYRLAAGFSTLLRIAQENPELLGDLGQSAEQVASFVRILEEFLVNLVPLQCRIVGYDAVEIDGEQLLVHHDLLNSLPKHLTFERRPAYVSGVTEESLYWKDTRRVLYSRTRATVLARLSHGQLTSEWNPVRLTDLLREVSPSMAAGVEMGLKEAVRVMRVLEQNTSATVDRPLAEARAKALLSYGVMLLGPAGPSPEQVPELETKAAEAVAEYDRDDGQRKAYEVIEKFVTETFGMTVERALLSGLRRQAREAAGLDLDGHLLNAQPHPTLPSGGYQPVERHVEVEVIGIYW